ncbi:hypothetical protein RSOLAG22IIIB_03858 [Rhizoctonia solani]|uniref:Ricin B lectin domain-containing protein n=1 Tax=Rhizoctonia solani TaxID=456999 RepID=A0A0K6FTM5_9AGAM|nr:hypothetical protein RSOLAG22IIIB_03858 [Rhizoctonia solani]
MQAYAVYAMRLAEPGLQLFRYAAGQGVEHLQVDKTVEPGTYHICRGNSKKNGEKPEQQWYLQRSGSGYMFRNRKHSDLYLSVTSTDTHALVTASTRPSTWVLLKIGSCHGIKLAEDDKVIDLHFGRTANGTEVHIWPSNESKKQTWRLIRVGDGVGESRSPQEKIPSLESLKKEVLQLKDEIKKKDQQIAGLEGTICQLKADLATKKSSQAKLSQQQTEIASLQAKVDRLEYLVSQLRGNAKGNPM